MPRSRLNPDSGNASFPSSRRQKQESPFVTRRQAAHSQDVRLRADGARRAIRASAAQSRSTAIDSKDWGAAAATPVGPSPTCKRRSLAPAGKGKWGGRLDCCGGCAARSVITEFRAQKRLGDRQTRATAHAADSAGARSACAANCRNEGPGVAVANSRDVTRWTIAASAYRGRRRLNSFNFESNLANWSNISPLASSDRALSSASSKNCLVRAVP